MKKQIMTAEELVAEYKNKGIAPEMNLGFMETRLQENCVEISMNVLSRMQNIADMGRDVLIRDFISVWAREAEMEWIADYEKNIGECSYYDFIDSFSERKLQEFREVYDTSITPKKKAMLVTFSITSRVVVNESAMPEVEEEDAVKKAIENIKNNPDGYICYDNFDSIENDTECPYDPETDN